MPFHVARFICWSECTHHFCQFFSMTSTLVQTLACWQKMDLEPFRRNFEKIRNWQKYYHISKKHRKLSKIAKFGCKMFYTIKNIVLQIWQIFYTFALRVDNNTHLIPLGIHFSRIIQNHRKFANFARPYFL